MLLAPDKPRPERRADDRRSGELRRSRRKSVDGESSETYRIEVGKRHGVKPGNIVGAITNEAGLEGRYIGHIDIRWDHSYVEMPGGMPNDIFQDLKKTRVAGQKLNITREGEPPPKPEPDRPRGQAGKRGQKAGNSPGRKSGPPSCRKPSRKTAGKPGGKGRGSHPGKAGAKGRKPGRKPD